MDHYVGKLARTEMYIENEEPKLNKAEEVLRDLMKRQPQRIEAYLKLWSLYYNCGNFH